MKLSFLLYLTAALTGTALVDAIACQANQAALNLIKESEGFRARFYIDPAGVRTIGYGHACIGSACNGIREPITKAQGEALLKQDLKSALKCLKTSITVPLNDNQLGALASFTFNLGCGNLRSSTLRKRLNAKENPNKVAEQELPKWVYGGGKVLPGLVKRRKKEVALFKTPSSKPGLPCQ
ncbi:uncharacterized protein VTP21DRAFT_143 [Calcarisporiella thermophila]|uniref:uncharacterized protein n=1 Tax=Calcarisporiella thermophila TaxID=911321 RepID=UPI00374292D1